MYQITSTSLTPNITFETSMARRRMQGSNANQRKLLQVNDSDYSSTGVATAYPHSKLPTQIATNAPTHEPTVETYCLRVDIDTDVHKEDINWTVSSDASGIIFKSDYSSNDCVGLLDQCVEFVITDAFGDGLNYGEGSWTVSFENYSVSSFSGGYFAFEESLTICDPKLWMGVNNETAIVSLILSANDSISEQAILLANALKTELVPIFDDRLFVDIVFTDIKSISEVLGYEWSFPTMAPSFEPTKRPTSIPSNSSTAIPTNENLNNTVSNTTQESSVFELIDALCIRNGRYCCDTGKGGSIVPMVFGK